MPKLTIGIPVYNGENFLRAAVESILAQSFGDFELLISDNASTDGTAEICSLLAQTDGRIQYERLGANLGAARNFNRLVDAGTGDYFKWAAHDDLIEPEYIARCVAALDSDHESVLAHSRTRIVDSDGQHVRFYDNPLDCERAYRSSDPHVRFQEMIRGVHACYEVFGVIRSNVLRGTGMIGPFISSDRVLLAELALLGKTCEIEEPLFLSRDHGKRSVRSMRVHDRAEWFDSSNRTRTSFPYWRLHLELAKAVRRSARRGAVRRGANRALALTTLRQSRMLRGDVLRAIKTRWTR